MFYLRDIFFNGRAEGEITVIYFPWEKVFTSILVVRYISKKKLDKIYDDFWCWFSCMNIFKLLYAKKKLKKSIYPSCDTHVLWRFLWAPGRRHHRTRGRWRRGTAFETTGRRAERWTWSPTRPSENRASFRVWNTFLQRLSVFICTT